MSRIKPLRGLVLVMMLLAPVWVAAAANPGHTVTVLAVADSLDPDLLDQFEHQSGTRVFVDSYPSRDALLDALRSHRYDIALVDAGLLPGLAKAGVLAPITLPGQPTGLQSDLTNRVAALAGGEHRAVPLLWSASTIVAHTDKLAERHVTIDAATAWDVVFAPDSLRRLSDCGVGVPDDGRELYAAALGRTAQDPAHPDPAEIRRALASLVPLRTLTRRLPRREIVEGLAAGTLCLGILSGSDAWQVSDRGDGSAGAPTLLTPAVGGRLTIDTMVLAAGAPNTSDALRLVAFLLQPAAAAQSARFAHALAGVSETADPTARRLVVVPEDDPVVTRGLEIWAAKVR